MEARTMNSYLDLASLGVSALQLFIFVFLGGLGVLGGSNCY
jgi:hypothetical protein